jgi:hypothetical protein
MNSNERGIVLSQKDTYFLPDTYSKKKRLIGKVQQLNWVKESTISKSKKKTTIIILILKRLKTILAERSHLLEGKLPTNKCTPKYTNSLSYPLKKSNGPPCCLARILANHKDFFYQKSAIKKLLLARGYVCVFLPKFHYELNPIEMY